MSSEVLHQRQIDPASGCFSSVMTSLEMRSPQAGPPPSPPGDHVVLERWSTPPVDEYLALFRRVGDPWLWYGRLRSPRREIARLMQSADHDIWRLWCGDQVAGFCELNRATPGEVEIAYFGLVPEHIGGGLGGYLMRSMLREAWRGDVERVWLHTCTEDHPDAIHFYRHMGFSTFERKHEWIRDPRLDGLLPRDAGPHVPIAE